MLNGNVFTHERGIVNEKPLFLQKCPLFERRAPSSSYNNGNTVVCDMRPKSGSFYFLQNIKEYLTYKTLFWPFDMIQLETGIFMTFLVKKWGNF